MATALNYVPNFRTEPQKFTLHNSTPEDITVRWHGVQFTIPSVDRVGEIPATDADGDLIPGTFVLQDGYCPDANGAYPNEGQYNWLAASVIKNALGINPSTGAAEGPYAKKGVSFLPNNPSKDLIKEIKQNGMRRWQAFLVEWANYEVSAYREAADKCSRLGIAAPPPGPDYTKAILILKTNEDVIGRTIGHVTEVIEQAADDDELEFKAYAKAAALKLVGRAAEDKQVDKEKVAEAMLEDPEVLKHLRRKYRIRKVGHLEGSEE